MAARERSGRFSRYQLEGIVETNEEIGRGSYAIVEGLDYRGLSCVAKSIHRELYDSATAAAQVQMLERFANECELLSQIRHPHIVQFLGVYFKRSRAAERQGGVPLPAIVMERLHCTLASAIDRHGRLPEEICPSIFYDVATALAYLHACPIIHRDLSANNILLTPNMTAKISDLGVAKILDLSPARMTQMTTCPGTPSYMPPEALATGQAVYTTKMDIFSYGNLMTHVLSGQWPIPTQAFRYDPSNPNASPVPITEVERREEYLRDISEDHALMELIRRCLSNNPAARPEASDILRCLNERAPQHPLLFTDRVEALQRISERAAERQEQARQHRQEVEEKQREVEDKQREVEEKQQEVEEKQQEVEEKEEQVGQLRREMEEVRRQGNEQIEQKQQQIEEKQQRIDQLVFAHGVELESAQIRVSEVSGECEGLRASVRAKEEEVEAAEAMARAREKEVTAKEEEVTAVRQELAAKEELVETKDSESRTLDEQLGLMKQQLAVQYRQLALQDQLLAVKEAEVANKREEVKTLRQELTVKEREQGQQLAVLYRKLAAEERQLAVHCRQLAAQCRQLAVQCEQLAVQDQLLAAKEAEVANKRQEVDALRQVLTVKEKELGVTKGELSAVRGDRDAQREAVAARDSQLRAKEREIASQKDALASKESIIAQLRSQASLSLLLSPQSRLRWRRCADMPGAMTHPRMVRIGDDIYAGGGRSETHAKTLSRYTPAGDTWSTLPKCPTRYFGLTELNGKPVLVGGDTGLTPTSDVYNLDDFQVWRTSLPPLPTARFYLTVFRYKSFIIACGGYTHWIDSSNRTRTTAVEVFSSEKSQWYKAEPLPIAVSNMSHAIINDTCYLVGGATDGGLTKRAFCAFLPSLIQQAKAQADPQSPTASQFSSSPPPAVWRELPRCPFRASTAASLGDCLLAIGGVPPGSTEGTTLVHLYSPGTNSWVQVSNADIPEPRFLASATQLASGDIILMGGEIRDNELCKTVFVGSIEI